MDIAATHRSFSSASRFQISSAFLLILLMSLLQVVAAQPANGRNVNVVNFDQGTFRQISQNQWVEQNSAGQRVFTFNETGRDEWSVYLHDPSRNVRLQLDLHRKMIGYSDSSNPTARDQYPITSASSKLSGWLVREVRFDNGAYINQGGNRWVETDGGNTTRFNFNEVGRDDWSVYLLDPSRDVNIQLDLHTRDIMYNAGNEPRRPLYRIVSAR